MMNQRTAVYAAVVSVMGEIGTRRILDCITEAQLEQVEALVVKSFLDGQVELKEKPGRDAAWVKKYVPGLVNNWLRKDTKLNGDVKYTAKHPGSRTGSGDEALKAMKALLATTADPTAQSLIQGEIDKRKLELHPAVAINVDALPEALRHLVKA